MGPILWQRLPGTRKISKSCSRNWNWKYKIGIFVFIESVGGFHCSCIKKKASSRNFVFMHNSVNERAPSFNLVLIPPLVRETIYHLLRNDHKLSNYCTRAKILHSLCISSPILLWKSLNNNLKKINSLTSFKHQRKQTKKEKKKTWNFSDN